ncbi:ATP phosphoribosyltransferase regulatory subunit [Amedibacillus sp. YH-ame6]
MKQFRIPEGTRDLILTESKMKRILERRIEQVFDSYGFQEIITPSIEYYQTYQTGFETVKDEQMYKFFDHNGSILTLRMDMTVPIARVVTTKFKDQKPPFRFRYCADVFKVKEYFAGKRNEVSDCGVELIGLEDYESDLEMLVCALEVMDAMKQDSYTLEIGNVNFFMQACKDLSLANDTIETLADFIDRKSMIELEEYLTSLDLNEGDKTFFLQLPWLCGDGAILKDAQAYCFNEHLKAILENLQLIDAQLCELGFEGKFTFDLGKVPHLNYYSGIIFEGFVEGIGTSVLSGGRYDTLLEKFGEAMPAIGFSVKLDYVLPVLKLEDDEKETVILCYPVSKKVEALRLASEMRKHSRVQLLTQDREDIVMIKEENV